MVGEGVELEWRVSWRWLVLREEEKAGGERQKKGGAGGTRENRATRHPQLEAEMHPLVTCRCIVGRSYFLFSSVQNLQKALEKKYTRKHAEKALCICFRV